MAVDDLQCPNCGAPIGFAGSTQVTCSFCQSKLYFTPEGVRAEGGLTDTLEGKPATAGIDLSGVQEQLRAGKKIEAIKLYREQTGVGLREAKEAVEAIERGETPALPSPQLPATSPNPYGIDLAAITALVRQGNKIGAIKLYREQTGIGLKEAKDAVEALERGEMPVVTVDQRRGALGTSAQSRRASTSGCLGCLPILLFIGLCAGLIMLSSQIAFRAWGPLDQVMKILNNDPQVRAAFGQPLSVGSFIAGNISGGDTSSLTHFGVPLYGPKHSGTLQVSGSWRRGVWDISINVLYDGEDGEEQTIYITQKVK